MKMLNSHTFKLIALVLSTLAGILAIVALIFAPGAKADTSDFTDDLARNGFHNSGGLQAELIVGNLVCTSLAHGSTVSSVVDDLTTQSQMNRGESSLFVSISVRDLCPHVLDDEDVSRISHHHRHGHRHTYLVDNDTNGYDDQDQDTGETV